MILVKWLSIAERYSKIYLDRLLAPLGLNSSQHMYITVICRNPGITQEEFTELTYLNPSNITPALNSLIRSGFISKETDPKDRRKNCLYPTAKAYEPTDRFWMPSTILKIHYLTATHRPKKSFF